MVAHRSSALAILAVLVTELAAAIVLGFFVAQGYIAYECGHGDYRAAHRSACEGGFPYPLF
jgi:hypothetical protein